MARKPEAGDAGQPQGQPVQAVPEPPVGAGLVPAPSEPAPESQPGDAAVTSALAGAEPLYRVYLSKSCPVDVWHDPQSHLAVTKEPQDNIPARRLSVTAWAELHVTIEEM